MKGLDKKCEENEVSLTDFTNKKRKIISMVGKKMTPSRKEERKRERRGKAEHEKGKRETKEKEDRKRWSDKMSQEDG